MKLKTKEWNWAEGAEQAKSKMKSIYWWNGWLALPALLRKRNGAQPKEPKAPRQALQLTLSLSARSSAVKRENEVEGRGAVKLFFWLVMSAERHRQLAKRRESAPLQLKLNKKQIKSIFLFLSLLARRAWASLFFGVFGLLSLVVGYKFWGRPSKHTIHSH